MYLLQWGCVYCVYDICMISISKLSVWVRITGFGKPFTVCSNQTFRSICQTIINTRWQMLLSFNLLTFSKKSSCNREHLITWINTEMFHIILFTIHHQPPFTFLKWKQANAPNILWSGVHLLLLSQQKIYFNATNAHLVTTKWC